MFIGMEQASRDVLSQRLTCACSFGVFVTFAKVGLIGGSSGGDQILLQAILEANPNKEQPVLRLIDARPKLNAIANQVLSRDVGLGRLLNSIVFQGDGKGIRESFSLRL